VVFLPTALPMPAEPPVRAVPPRRPSRLSAAAPSPRGGAAPTPLP